jgi:hypothetical protein
VAGALAILVVLAVVIGIGLVMGRREHA